MIYDVVDVRRVAAARPGVGVGAVRELVRQQISELLLGWISPCILAVQLLEVPYTLFLMRRRCLILAPPTALRTAEAAYRSGFLRSRSGKRGLAV